MHLGTIRPVGYPPSPCSVSGKIPRIQYSLVVAACLASCFACGKSAGPEPAAGNSIHASPAPATPQAPPTAPPVPPAIAATPPALALPAPVTPTALSVGAIHIDVVPESGKLSPAEAQQIGNGLAEKLRHERTQLLAIGRILTVLERPGVQLPGQVTAAIRIECDGEGAVDTSTTVCQGPSIVAGDANPDYPETTVASVVVGWMPSGQLGRFGTTVPPDAAAGAVLLVTVHVSARAAIDFFKGSAPVSNRTPLPLAILGGFAPPPAKRTEITSVEIKVSTREEFDVFLMRGNSGKGFTVSATKCSADGCTIVPKCPENITGCDQGYDLRILGPDQFEIVPQDPQKGPIGPLPAGLYTRTEAASAPVGDTRTPGQIMAGFACCPSPGDETAKNCVQAVPKNCGACQRDLDCMGCECGCPASKCDAGQCSVCPEQAICTTVVVAPEPGPSAAVPSPLGAAGVPVATATHTGLEPVAAGVKCLHDGSANPQCLDPDPTACTTPNNSVHCRSKYSFEIRTGTAEFGTEFGDWERSGNWPRRKGEMFFLDLDRLAFRDGCYRAGTLHLCASPTSSQAFKDGKLREYIGFAKAVDYDDGMMIDDLVLQDVAQFEDPIRIARERAAMRIELAARKELMTGEWSSALAMLGSACVFAPTNMTDKPQDINADAQLAAALESGKAILGDKYIDQFLGVGGRRTAKLERALECQRALVTAGAGSTVAAAGSHEAVSVSALQRLAYQVGQRSWNSYISENEWALLPPGTTDCKESLTKPPTQEDYDGKIDEFKRRETVARRPALRAGFIGAKVASAGAGDVAKSAVQVGEYALERGEYDFSKHVYHLTLSATGGWPLSAESPRVTKQTFRSTDKETIGSVGDQEVQVNRVRADTDYEFEALLRLDVPATESEARRLKESMPVHLVLVQQIVGLGYHKVCKRSCMEMLGQVLCDSDNTGLGTFVRAKLQGYELYVDGKLVIRR